MLEALYNVARCKVLSGDIKGALENLETVILQDRNYCLKVYAETDFDSIQNEFSNLIVKLKKKVFENAWPVYEDINKTRAEFKSLGGKYSSELERLISEWVPEQFTVDMSYFDLIDTQTVFGQIRRKLEAELQTLKVEIIALNKTRENARERM
jgi:hypothetical protein